MSAQLRSAACATQTRAFPLDDLTIRSGGDGRTVEAYAAVFDTPSEIRDQDGHYSETISRSAFNKTIADRGLRFGVFYNHGMTLHGTPSERHSMPLGAPVEVRADNRGVLTVTRYDKIPLADEILEGIRSGSIRGQSFTGRMIRSSPERGRAQFRARPDGSLTTVQRDEIAMVEYGPTPFPAYETADIMGVRSQALDPIEALLGTLRDGDRNLEAFEAVLRSLGDDSVERAKTFVAETSDDEEPAFLARLQALATRLDGAPAGANATEAPAAAGETKTLARHQVRARLRKVGLL